jgi:hypothetical protein
MPRRLPTVLLVASLALGVPLAGACSKDDDEPRRRAAATTTSSTAPAGPPTIALTVLGVDPHGTKPPDDAIVAAVKATLDRWLADAVIAPLHSGQPAGDLSAVFTPAALERLAADPAARATLVDEGLPPASTEITAERANVNLASVAGPDEVVGVIAAQLDVKLRAVGPTMDVDVNHYGEVVLVQEPDGWKIDSFAVETARDSRQA